MPLFPFLKRKNASDREPVGMASPAEQVQAARVRARRRLIGAVLLLGVGIVGFPMLFETQPRPLPVEVSIEIPRKDGGAPLVLPSRGAPITETADEAGREVPPPAQTSAAAPAIRPVAPAAASAPRVAAAPASAVPAAKASAPIRVLADPPRSSVAASASAPKEPTRDLAKELAAREAKDKAAREAKERDAAREREVAAREAKEAKDKAAREAKEREAAREREVAAKEAKDKAAREAKERDAAREREVAAREAKDKAAREAREREAAREAVAREALRDRSNDSVEKRYIVQVGAFADATAAGEARARVEKLGIRTFTQVVETDAGRRIRVRVGPFASREEADKALGKLKAAGLPTALLPL
ncbi:SPOR domain-containing protein [Azohydromonas lata]|uniref:SPOR domain-containing protein n=1 Tax=Azohydromonas lata TaxID=45677 RepID=A0ABU5IRI9_9BURK|nr:SPOR domain-containing protein [Azohydromonas lata]MDZ5461509.1 SPOR domain-containing protein [Azohydromonas lata]